MKNKEHSITNVNGLTKARVAELAERHWAEWTERGWRTSPEWEDLHPLDRMQLFDAMRATMAAHDPGVLDPLADISAARLKDALVSRETTPDVLIFASRAIHHSLMLRRVRSHALREQPDPEREAS